jgi:hypothetical protein
MPLAGKTLMPRDGAAALAVYFGHVGDVELTKGVATGLGESQLSVGAWHDNPSTDGTHIVSRDCGWMEHSIDASLIGTAQEAALRSVSTDPAVYTPVVDTGARLTWEKYNQPWTRNGRRDIRRWQPWFAYTLGWATFPEWWVWEHGVGPWVSTGRYVQRAICGVANHWLVHRGAQPSEALQIAVGLQGTFKVKGTLEFSQKRRIVIWSVVPGKPSKPPADGVGPRPIQNDGR